MTVRKMLKKYRPLLVLSRPIRSEDSDEEVGSKQLSKEFSMEEGGTEKLKLYGEELYMEDGYSEETVSTLWTGTSSVSSQSGDSDLGSDMTRKIKTTALNNDWDSFCEFLSNRSYSLNISGFSAKDVIDFLRMRRTSGEEAEALVGSLSATYVTHGIGPMGNPFRSQTVATYIKLAREITGETDCILVFSCDDNHDVDKTFFIEAISMEFHKRKVTPLMYNLLGGEKLDEEMLDRSNVGIMILCNSCVCSMRSMDHLVKIMEHGKATNLVIIPIYFKVTLSDICGWEGRLEPLHPQYVDSAQLGRVQKWKVAMAGIDGHEWKKEKEVLLAEEVVRTACLRLYLKNSKNLKDVLLFLNRSQPLDAHIVGLWGMAGIGKTSIAREIFGMLSPQYHICYFVQDFYVMRQKKGLRQMREDFFSKRCRSCSWRVWLVFSWTQNHLNL